MQKLKSCLQKLEPLKKKTIEDIDTEPYLKDIIERNFEVAAQCILDISNRVIADMQGERPTDYFTGILILGDYNVLPKAFAKKLAPVAGLRNILVHQYLDLDWHRMLNHLNNLSDLYKFIDYIEQWQRNRNH